MRDGGEEIRSRGVVAGGDRRDGWADAESEQRRAAKGQKTGGGHDQARE